MWIRTLHAIHKSYTKRISPQHLILLQKRDGKKYCSEWSLKYVESSCKRYTRHRAWLSTTALKNNPTSRSWKLKRARNIAPIFYRKLPAGIGRRYVEEILFNILCFVINYGDRGRGLVVRPYVCRLHFKTYFLICGVQKQLWISPSHYELKIPYQILASHIHSYPQNFKIQRSGCKLLLI